MARDKDRRRAQRKAQQQKQSARRDRVERRIRDRLRPRGEHPAVAAVQERLMRDNPEYGGAGQFEVRDGRIVAAGLAGQKTPNLAALVGQPIERLDAAGAGVADLEPLRGAPLRMLWLNDCPVRDMAPLADCPLVSLTLADTNVADLSPLANVRTLERLHIAGAPPTDLRPLAGLTLTRLVFDAAAVTDGLDAIRQMPTLRELGPDLEHLLPPAAFWARVAEAAAPQ